MRDVARTALSALALGLGLTCAAAPSSAAVQAPESIDARLASQAARQMADWVIASGDNGGLPFVIIDKVAAEVAVFDPDGALRGAAPALLGLARGDDSVPGIGERRLSAIAPDERTTQAGRFLAGFGYAAGDRKVLWVDYATAISLHPVVTTNSKEQRLKRLQSSSPQDNRITYGCINVSAAFYRDVVRKTFSGTTGVVYILPETKALAEVFPAFRLQAARADRTDRPSDQGPDLASSEETRILEANSAGTDAAVVR